jgi:hypothetical protein
MKKVFVWVAAVLAVGLVQFVGVMPASADNSAVVIASGDQKPADAAAPAEEVKEEAAPAQGEEVQPPAEEEPAPEEGQEVKDSGSNG